MEHRSKYYNGSEPVSIVPLGEYGADSARAALEKVLAPIGGLDFVKAGETVVIKANLVSAMKPDAAATTHPDLICALVDMLVERGAEVIVGDSPGGIYTQAFVGRVYTVSGIREAEKHGAKLNDDFSQCSARFDDACVLREFTYTGYLDKADHIINFCKLKSHGMMGMSCAAKNMFGAIPGIIKPEYHFRFPKYEDFADMIVDLDEYFHPTLSIADAVIGMEGNGPTAGTPRRVGCLLASRSPHALDLVAAKIIGITPSDVPTLAAAQRRGMIPESVSDITLIGSMSEFVLSDFELVVERHSLEFSSTSKNPIKRFFGKIAAAILRTKPKLKKDLCVGCGVCANICPAKAMTIKNKKVVIDRKKCIRCFCCQEFCPKSAMKVKRTFIAEIFHREKK